MTATYQPSNPAAPCAGNEANVVGFLDDDPRKQNRRILGVPVLGGSDRLEEILAAGDISEVVISSPKITPANLRHVTAVCEPTGVSISHAAVRIE